MLLHFGAIWLQLFKQTRPFGITSFLHKDFLWPTGFHRNPSRFPQNKPPPRSSAQCTSLMQECFVSGLVPSPSTSEEGLCLVLKAHQDSPLLTPRSSTSTAQQKLVTRAAHGIEMYLQRKAVVLRQREYWSWADWAHSVWAKKTKLSWTFFFSPKNPGEVTHTETYTWSLVLSITEQHDIRIWSYHPEVWQLLILPIKVLILQ